MPANSNRIGPAPVPQSQSSLSSTKNFRQPGTVRLIEQSDKESTIKPSSSTSYSIETKSDPRMLQARGITSSRLETLALMDFHPLFEGSKKTIAGSMLDVRYALREIDKSTVKKLISDLALNNEAAFQNALDIYRANLESSKVDVALLKTAYLMKEYGARAFSYNSHLQNHKITSPSYLSIGNNALEFYASSLGFSISGKSDVALSQNATVMFLQFLADFSLFSRVGFPRVLASKQRKLLADAIQFDAGVSTSVPSSLPQNCIRVSRELAASLKINEVISGTGEETNVHSTFKSNIPSSFFSVASLPTSTVFQGIFGFDSWILDSSTYSFKIAAKSPKPVTSLITLSGLAGVVDSTDSSYLLLEDSTKVYGSKTYLPANAVVNSAFKPKSPLDFSIYSSNASAFYTKCNAAATICRGLYYPNFDFRGSTSGRIAGSERLNSLVLFQSSLSVFRKKFLSKLYATLYDKKIETYQKQLSYAQVMAHVFIKDDPMSASKILKYFVSDYMDGNLNTDLTSRKSSVPTTSKLESGKKFIRDWLAKREKVSNYSLKDSNSSNPLGYPSKQSDQELNIVSDGDLRAVTAIYAVNDDTIQTFENMILFEVLSYGIAVIKDLMSRFQSINSLLDTNENLWPNPGIAIISSGAAIGGSYTPTIPTSTQVPTPYYGSNVFSAFMADSGFDPYSWIPTIQAFMASFTRGSLGKTLFSGIPASDMFMGIFNIHSRLMSANFPMLKVKTATLDGTSSSKLKSQIYLGFLAINKPNTGAGNSNSTNYDTIYSTYFSQATKVADSILVSNSSSYNTVQISDLGMLGQGFLQSLKSTVTDLRDDDTKLKTAIEILSSFGSRAEKFSNYAIDTFTGNSDDTNAVYELATSLVKLGNPGLDVLENLSSEQICLRNVTYSRQIGSQNNGYLPTQAIISSREKFCIESMARNSKVRAPEGLNLRCLTVGLPASMLKNQGIVGKFSVSLTYTDLEYSDLVFLPRKFNFDSSIFVPANGFDSVTSYSDFRSVVNQVNFLKTQFLVQEVPGNAPRLEQKDTQTVVRANSKEFDVYLNTAVSALLDLYYKAMVGVDLSEDAFESETADIGVPLNKYAGNLGAALASLSLDLLPAGSKLSDALKSRADITTGKNLERAAKIEGFSELDAEFIASVRNSFTTRLLSAEDMRDTILKAKVFDRVFHMLIDPDEFIIATKGSNSKSFTSNKILDKYLKSKTIEQFVENGVTKYKLAPRKVSEGRMAFCKIIAIVEPSTGTAELMVKV